ncbi:baseplate hub subunit and tail lysozyme [Erwinia phage phiEa2809]|uniref:Baseplate hub subunit and tail lysozyme n=1 Tax=Erwinia phage phiEa2809 TaxID=1564096 RepID=A0A0A0YXE4_9CAUD|nr:baseplate hub subunit and tail lysozyme [Erwinia phage phiEa2809]AIX13063.1 baseplate hub subunit and tail lysozyme [Erwinia phage phiEa2809]
MLPEKRWFYACVEDVNDPDQNGRIAIRIAGVHTQDKTVLPTEFLPWAKCLMPVTNASSVGLGAAPTGVTVGTWIEGYALDEAYQEVRACWVWTGQNPINGSDTNPLALGQVVQAIDRQQYNAIENIPVKQEDETPAPPPPEPVPEGADAQKWMEIASGEIGTKEYAGKFNNNPRIIEYHKTTSLAASQDEVSWCAAFVGWCLIKAGYTATRSALARSYVNWGSTLAAPRFGAVVVFRRGNNPTFGHVGFVQRFDANYIYCLGGNQSDSVKISRFPRSSVLSYRWPTGLTTEAAAPAQKNGKWSEPIPDRTPKPVTTPPPSGNIQDSDVTGEAVVPTQGGSKYPYNIPFASRSGHLIEIDDTPGGERLHWMHTSGSYKQMLADGDVVNKSMKDHYDITKFDKKIAVGGDHNFTVGGSEVKRKEGPSYSLYNSQKTSVVNGPQLQKVSGVHEIHAGEVHRIIADLIEGSGTLRIPKIEVGSILADNLEVKNVINGNIKYAEGAGRAPVKAGATPASPSGPGNIDIKATLNDTGGNFDKPIQGEGSAPASAKIMANRLADTSSSTSESAAEATPVAMPMSFPITTQLPSASQYPDMVIILRQAGSKPQMMLSNGSTWEAM